MATDYMYGQRDMTDRGIWSDMNRWGTKDTRYGGFDRGFDRDLRQQQYGGQSDMTGEFDRGYGDWTRFRKSGWNQPMGYNVYDINRPYSQGIGSPDFQQQQRFGGEGFGGDRFYRGGGFYGGGMQGFPAGWSEVDWNNVFARYPSTWQRQECYLPMFGERQSDYQYSRSGDRDRGTMGRGWDRDMDQRMWSSSSYPGDLASSGQFGRMGMGQMGSMGGMGMGQMGMGMGQRYGRGGRMWTPRCDIRDNQNFLICEFELPGVAKDQINLSVGDNYLMLQSSQDMRFEKEGSLFQNERHSGQFFRRVELPFPVDANQSQAVLEHGILRITLPKKNIGISNLGGPSMISQTTGFSGQTGGQIPPGYKMSKKGVLKPIKEKEKKKDKEQQQLLQQQQGISAM